GVGKSFHITLPFTF
uniref:Uncharacterized protein n=1 Tax=Amphimedon queenslandica TaxID=400682 RepID=A0A1X7V7P0_AMPQE